MPLVSTMRAGHNGDSWINTPRLVHDHPCHRRIVEGYHQHARVLNSRVLEHPRIGAVAHDRRESALAQLLNSTILLIDDQMVEPTALECLSKDSTHPAMPA